VPDSRNLDWDGMIRYAGIRTHKHTHAVQNIACFNLTLADFDCSSCVFSCLSDNVIKQDYVLQWVQAMP